MKTSLTLIFLVTFQVFCAHAQMPDICLSVKAIRDIDIKEDVISFRASGTMKMFVENTKPFTGNLGSCLRGPVPGEYLDVLAKDCVFTIKREKTDIAGVDEKRESHWQNTIGFLQHYKEGEKIYISVYTAQVTIAKNLVTGVTGTGPWTVPSVPKHLADKSDLEKKS